uniref:DUF4283 domain-containing protein n=1 Tax=Schistosoma curassoni TaxID=6186 RepID=A0A183KXL6_9TREM
MPPNALILSRVGRVSSLKILSYNHVYTTTAMKVLLTAFKRPDSRLLRERKRMSSSLTGLVDIEDLLRGLENPDYKPIVHMGSKILAYDLIVGYRLPWDYSTTLWVRPLGQRLRVWPPKKTTYFSLDIRTVFHPPNKSNDKACPIYIWCLLVSMFMCLNKYSL